MSPAKLNLTPSQASSLFNLIFKNKTLTPKMLRENWATHKNKKGGNMYIDRIIKPAGTFTREEIVASEEAATQIRKAWEELGFELPVDVEMMEEDTGPPIDATVLHPTTPLSRLPRGVVDGHVFPLGYQPQPADYVDATTLWYEDDDSVRRRVCMYPGEGPHTHRQVNQYVTRTPSVEPRIVRNTFRPVASGHSDDSDLEGQAEERRIRRAQPPAAEQQRYAQKQSRREREKQKRALVSHGRAAQPRDSRLERIEESDEEEADDEQDLDDGGENDSEEEEDENNGGPFDAVDPGQHTTNDHQFNMVDLPQEEKRMLNENHHSASGSRNTRDSDDGQFEIVKRMSPSMRATSISDTNDPPARTSAAVNAQQVEEDRYIIPTLKAMLNLSPTKRIEIFRAAFPTVKDHEVNKFSFRTHAEIKHAWHHHRHHPHMFDYDDALTSPDSPLSPLYVPRIRLFHRFAVRSLPSGDADVYKRPAIFNAVPPTEDIYKCGGPVMHVVVEDSNGIEDILVCNDAFCSMCAFSQAQPPTGDPDYNLGSMPFVHTKELDIENMALKYAGGPGDVGFVAGGIWELTAVPGKELRRAVAVEVLFLDGHSRPTVVCDQDKCDECKAG